MAGGAAKKAAIRQRGASLVWITIAVTVNAVYAGSSALLSRVSFIAGSPSEAADLLRAGALTARSAVILSASKVSASADGSDNLNDDTDVIVATATLYKLNPELHVVRGRGGGGEG